MRKHHSVQFFRVLCLVALVATSFAALRPTQAQATVTLKYVSWMSKGEDKPILADFMKKYPNIKVEDEVLEGASYDKLLKPRIIGGDAPDVFLFMPGQYQPFVKEGWLLDVTGEAGTQIMKKSDSIWSYYNRGGKVYGTLVNGGYNDQPIYYNKKYFTKLGLKAPTTEAEFFAILEKIKADGKDALVFGGKDVWPYQMLFRGFRESEIAGKYKGGDPLLKLNKGELTNADIYGSTLTLAESIFSKGYVGKASQTLTYDQSVQYFVDGKAGLLPQGPWVPGLDAIKKADPATFELGAFAYPLNKYDGKVSITAGSDRNIGISATTKHPAEAKLLYNFFLSKENLEKYLETQSLTTVIPGIEPKVSPALADYLAAHKDYQVYFDFNDPQILTIPGSWDGEYLNSVVNIFAGSNAKTELARFDDVFAQLKDKITVANR